MLRNRLVKSADIKLRPRFFPDICGSDFRARNKVCIVAPGPNGRDFYKNIPRDYQVCAVSKAVLIDDINPEVWVSNQLARDWCMSADREFKGVRIFNESAVRVAIDGILSVRGVISGRILRYWKNCYSYQARLPEEDRLDVSTIKPINPGMIRGFGSVSGCALQIAYLCGARDILLSGVDISGDHYWDGSNTTPPEGETHGANWWFIPRVNNLIKWLTDSASVRVRTLSPTKLDIPIY
jgi:hypothetical protein